MSDETTLPAHTQLPQWIAERIRAGGAGIGAFFTPTGYGTIVAEGKETRVIDVVPHVLEMPLKADFALIKAYKGDQAGNLVYRKTARNFSANSPCRAGNQDSFIIQPHLSAPFFNLNILPILR
jgi:3-oxoacid CoA-transferase A subunit